jgi:S-formylglutathione hydrolase FrmB
MRTILLAAAVVVSIAACSGDQLSSSEDAVDAPNFESYSGITVSAVRWISARTLEVDVSTPLVAPVAVNGPHRLRVTLPADYFANAGARYPVLYLLHGGAGGNSAQWTTGGGAVEDITDGQPIITVMPDGGKVGWFTNWVDQSQGAQRWADFYVDQVIPWVDHNMRTVAAANGRAIAGLSMGGYGALSYAARHPDTFAAAASFSGALEVGSSDAWGERSANEARWRAHLPIAIATRLRSLALVELRTGDGRPGPLDRRGTKPGCEACGLERFLRAGNVRLHARLRALGIRHVWDDYGPGTHDWPYWRRDLRETLPDLLRALARPLTRG